MIILSLLLFLFAVIAYFRPSWGLGIILSLLPTYLIRFTIQIPTTFLELLIVVFLFVVVVRMHKADWQKLARLKTANLAIGLFVLAAGLSTLISPDRLAALGQLKAFIIEPILLFYAALIVLKTEHDKRFVVRCLFLSAAGISLFGIVQYFTFLLLPLRFWGSGSEVTRIVGVFEYPNALALYLAPLIGFFAVLWQKRFELFHHRAWLTVGLVIMTLALILTFSRGAWAALVATALILALRRLDYRRIVALGALILILLAIPSVRARLGLGLRDASSQAHGELMQIGLQKVITNPLLGNGLAGFPATLKEASYAGEAINYPHNIFLNFWLELGVLGLISFAWIISLSLRQHHKKTAALTWAAGVFLIVMLLHGLVDVPYFKNDLSILFWVMISFFFTQD